MTDRQNITVQEGNERLRKKGGAMHADAERTTTTDNPKPPRHGKIIADQDDDAGAEKRRPHDR